MHQSNIRCMIILILAIAHFFTYSAAPTRKCSIKQLVGTVKIRRGASPKWIPARLKMPLKQKDAIRTFMESEAELVTTEGTVIKVGENTTIEMKTFKGTPEDQNTKVKIMNGAIMANVKKLVSTKSKFEFETPTATAAIRGTIVGFEVKKDQTKIKVYEGKVFVMPAGSKKGVELKENQIGVVQKGEKNVAISKFDASAEPVLLSTPTTDSTIVDSTSDSSGVVKDSSESTDTTSSIDSSGQSSLSVTLSSPSDGAQYQPSSLISVNGMVKPSGAKVTINGKGVTPSGDGSFQTSLNAPETAGDMEISIIAEYNGTNKSITRRISIIAGKLVFIVSVPRDGQEFSKPILPVSGTVTPGAEVSVLSMKLPVSTSGSFSGQVPIANEAGELTLEFDASLNDATQKITRRVIYKPEYRFIVTSPADRQTVTTTNLIIKGEVVPTNAEVSVMGRRLSVTNNGQFSGIITISEEEGEVLLDFEIVAGGLNKTEIRKIIYKKPPDTYRPQLSASLAKSCWNITVFDRTEDEEITLWYEIDGSKEFKTLRPNESTCIPLENGVHSYRVYAEDKSKNMSATETLLNHSYLATTTWFVKMRKPAGNIVIDIPPSSPAGEISHYPLEFTIENLPQDDMRLIREIIVTNRTNGRSVTLRTFTDNFIETDIELVRQRNNQIQIEVHDINNIIKSYTLQINVR